MFPFYSGSCVFSSLGLILYLLVLSWLSTKGVAYRDPLMLCPMRLPLHPWKPADEVACLEWATEFWGAFYLKNSELVRVELVNVTW